jgi:hypothetical protein
LGYLADVFCQLKKPENALEHLEPFMKAAMHNLDKHHYRDIAVLYAEALLMLMRYESAESVLKCIKSSFSVAGILPKRDQSRQIRCLVLLVGQLMSRLSGMKNGLRQGNAGRRLTKSWRSRRS